MSTTESLVVVRGNKTDLDPDYSCVANDGKCNRYALLRFRGSQLYERELYEASERKDLENLLAREVHRGTIVEADSRTDCGLLPLTVPEHANKSKTVAQQFRRAKSDDEIDALLQLSKLTEERLDNDNVKHLTFRSSAQKHNYRSAFDKQNYKGFVQYRAGFKDELGRCSDLTRVDAKTPKWEERLDRVYRGLYAVQDKMQVGTSVDDLNETFLSHLDPMKDVVYGNVVTHIGQQSAEQLPLKRLEAYDVLKVGCAVGEVKPQNLLSKVYRGTIQDPNEMPAGEVALIYQTVKAVVPAPPPPPTQQTVHRGAGSRDGEQKHDEPLGAIDPWSL